MGIQSLWWEGIWCLCQPGKQGCKDQVCSNKSVSQLEQNNSKEFGILSQFTDKQMQGFRQGVAISYFEVYKCKLLTLTPRFCLQSTVVDALCAETSKTGEMELYQELAMLETVFVRLGSAFITNKFYTAVTLQTNTLLLSIYSVSS